MTEQQQYPTREQTALVLARFDGYGYTTADELPEWRLDQADAVLALFQNGADR